jgi:hypothetical protein
MTLGTINNIMSTCQWEEGMIYTFSRPVKSIHAVALNTICRKASGCMVWVGRCIILIQMAIDTVITDPFKSQISLRYMAVITIGDIMCPQKRKSIIVMKLSNICYQPVLGVVTPGTIKTHGLVVHIRMT